MEYIHGLQGEERIGDFLKAELGTPHNYSPLVPISDLLWRV
jgi:hypothetical protein